MLGAEVTGPGDQRRLVTAVTADSRAVGPGTLFVALPASGPTVTPSSPPRTPRARPPRSPGTPVDDALCLVVTDPLVALGRLARHLVDRAVTGGLQVVGDHRLAGQDLDQGPARPGAGGGRSRRWPRSAT